MAESDRASDKKPTHMREMTERLGIDPAGGVLALSELTYLTALHRCQSCPSKAACRAWLNSMPMSVAFAPRFCPNSDLFFEMQFNQPGHIRGAYNDLCRPAPAKPDRGET
ncbi:MAG: DUF6455 family protein [Pseudolabrys sp.]|nr:DUF6455 family protein [Pseudolabrys sp.]